MQSVVLCLSAIVYAIAVAALQLYNCKQYNPSHYGRTYQSGAQSTGMEPSGFGAAHVRHATFGADWESGRKAPHTKNLTRLAVLLGVSFEWLTTGRGEMHASTTPDTPESPPNDWMLPEEHRLLSTYSRLKPKQRPALLGFLESLD